MTTTEIQSLVRELRGKTPEQRFWDKVDRKGDNECWNWLGCGNTRDKCGKFWYVGKMITAPAFSLIISGAGDPSGRLACHTCNNPNCVNPKHLYFGTHSTNAGDASRDGLLRKKLTSAHVLEIRERFSGGASQCALAREFGCSQQAVSRIVNRKIWRHI